MKVKCFQCKHIWDYEEDKNCPICGGELLIDDQLTRLSQAWIQYPIQPEIPKSIPLIRILLYLKLLNLEIVGMRCEEKEVKR